MNLSLRPYYHKKEKVKSANQFTIEQYINSIKQNICSFNSSLLDRLIYQKAQHVSYTNINIPAKLTS